MKSTAKDWDEVRTAFATSIMVDTSLSSLAQNLDAPDWPLKGKDETKGEAALRGHLKNGDDEQGGSSAYVPPDAKDDKQLNFAYDMLRGVKGSDASAVQPKDGTTAN